MTAFRKMHGLGNDFVVFDARPGGLLLDNALARKVADFGVKLEAGHLILPGSCTRAIDARPGSAFRAEFAGLGTVTASFE